MKVLYDHQIFDLQLFGGISRYFYELLHNFSADPEVDARLSFRYTNNFYLQSAPFLPLNRGLPKRNFKGKGFLNSFFIRRCNTRDNCLAIENQDYDLFHPTFYDPSCLEWIGGRPLVVTIHDLIYELFPEYYSPEELRLAAGMRQIAERAGQVIAVSVATKRDIVRLYGIPEEKVTVVHHGCSLPVEVKGGRGKGPAGHYILFVGERGRYKNFRLAAAAAAPLLRTDTALCLVCAGGGRFTEEEQRLFRDLGMAGRVRQFTVDDTGLTKLYSHAAVFIFPSLYEGFGMPVLEAFACGCPAVLSDRGALPEVGGEAARYFNPEDTEDMRRVMAEILRSPGLRREMREQGMLRVREFSWEKAAALTKAVYRKVI